MRKAHLKLLVVVGTLCLYEEVDLLVTVIKQLSQTKHFCMIDVLRIRKHVPACFRESDKRDKTNNNLTTLTVLEV